MPRTTSQTDGWGRPAGGDGPDPQLNAWIDSRLAGYTKLQKDAVKDMRLKRTEWAAIRTLCQEFGSVWGEDDEERRRRSLLVQRFMAQLPPVVVGKEGYETRYSAPFTYGTLLRALRGESRG